MSTVIFHLRPTSHPDNFLKKIYVFILNEMIRISLKQGTTFSKPLKSTCNTSSTAAFQPWWCFSPC